MLLIVFTAMNLTIYLIGCLSVILYRKEIKALLQASRLFRMYRTYLLTLTICAFIVLLVILLGLCFKPGGMDIDRILLIGFTFASIFIGKSLAWFGMYTLLIRSKCKWQVILASAMYLIPLLSVPLSCFFANISQVKYHSFGGGFVFTWPPLQGLLLLSSGANNFIISAIVIPIPIVILLVFGFLALRHKKAIHQTIAQNTHPTEDISPSATIDLG